MFLLFFPFIPIHSQEYPQDSSIESFFWRVDKAGLAPSYLLGTIHLGYTENKTINALYKDYFNRSDRLVLETTFEGPEFMQAMMRTINPNKDNKERLGSPLYNRLIELWKERGLNPLQIENSYPWTALMHLMYLPPNDEITLEAGIDIQLYLAAKQINKEVIGLESPLDAIDFFAEIPETIINESLRFVLDNFAEYQRAIEALVYAYFSNDIATVKSFIDDKALPINLPPELDSFWEEWTKEVLLIQRNNNWLPNVIKMLELGNSFIAVGAGHLYGQEGVVTLLKEAGYRLTPLN